MGGDGQGGTREENQSSVAPTTITKEESTTRKRTILPEALVDQVFRPTSAISPNPLGKP